MRKTEGLKKLFSILLCLCMLVQNCPVVALAAGAGKLCEHHTAHTADCGYVQEVAGQECAHKHDTGTCGYVKAVEGVSCECTQTDENGTLVHTEGCGFVAAVEGQKCTHSHDGSCGYVKAVKGSPCAYKCADCAKAGQPTDPPEPEETTQPSEPKETTQPSQPEETTQPSEPEETTEPSQPEHTHVYNGKAVYEKKDASAHTVTVPCPDCPEELTETREEAHTYQEGVCVCGAAAPKIKSTKAVVAKITDVTVLVNGKAQTGSTVSFTDDDELTLVFSGENFSKLNTNFKYKFCSYSGSVSTYGFFTVDTDATPNTATKTFTSSQAKSSISKTVSYTNPGESEVVACTLNYVTEEEPPAPAVPKVTGAKVSLNGVEQTGSIINYTDGDELTVTFFGEHFDKLVTEHKYRVGSSSGNVGSYGFFTVDTGVTPNTATKTFSFSQFNSTTNKTISYTNPDEVETVVCTLNYVTEEEPPAPAVAKITGVKVLINNVEQPVGEVTFTDGDQITVVFTGENFDKLTQNHKHKIGSSSGSVSTYGFFTIDSEATPNTASKTITSTSLQSSKNKPICYTNPGETEVVTGYTLTYQKPVATYTVTATASPAEGGSVTGGDTYEEGQSATVTATAKEDYTFVNWTEKGETVSTDASYTFTVTGSRELVANFAYVHSHSWSFSADGDTITAICAKADSCPDAEQTIWIQAEGKTYDGTPVEAELSGSIDGLETPEITYSGNTDAGTYTARISVEGKIAAAQFIITPKEVTPSVSGFADKTYNAGTNLPEGHGLSVSLEGVLEGDDLAAQAEFAFASPEAGTTAVRVANITLTGADAGNYQLKTDSLQGDFGRIHPVGLNSLEPDDYTLILGPGLTYNGTELTQTVESLSVFGLPATFTLTGNTATDAGDYTLTVTGTGNFSGTLTESWSIARKELSVTAEDQTVSFGTPIAQNLYTQTGLVEGHEVTSATLTASEENVTVSGTVTVSQVKITADEADVTDNYSITCNPGKLVILPDTAELDELTSETVTAEDKEVIEKAKAMMADANTAGADEKTLADWKAITDKCDSLLETLSAVEEEVDRICKAAENYTLETVKSSDKEAITALLEDTQTLLDGKNLTDAQRNSLEGVKTKLNTLLAKIDGTAAAVENLRKTVDELEEDSVKSTDKAALEQTVADAQTLLDSGNLTEEEQEALEQLQEDAQALLKVIDDTAAENKRLTDAVKAADPETVNSGDQETLEKLREDLEKQLEGDNLTEQEREDLQEALDRVEDMLTILEDTASDSAEATETVKDIDPDTVTSADQEALEEAIETIDALLEKDHLTEEERKALEETKKDAQALLDTIEKAQSAANTENTEKTEKVNAGNVKKEDKATLEKAKADLEKALKENEGHYTKAEKEAMEADIQRLEKAIEAVENAEKVTKLINALPKTVSPDDEKTGKKILEAKAAYDALTAHEKTLVDKKVKDKLNTLVAALTNYKITKGSGSKWMKKSSYNLTFTANGPYGKFTGVQVDGKRVLSLYYTAKSGSTVVTLKSLYLNRLSVGKHTVKILYTDGAATGTFHILAADSSPATGDSNHVLLWTGLLTASTACLAVMLVADRRRREHK